MFCIVEIKYFSIFYRYMWVFKYDFLTNFSSSILFTIDNRFLAPNSWEKVLWTSKPHFWEVRFFEKFWIKKNENIIYVSNQIIHCKTMLWKRNNVSHFFAFNISFWSQKKWTSHKWYLEVHRTFFEEFKVKKRLSMLKRMSNRQFWTKNDCFW